MSQSLNSPPTANISTTNNFFHHQQFSTNNNFLHPQAATRVGTGWSYLVAWAGVCLTLVVSFFNIFFSISILLFRSPPFLCFYFNIYFHIHIAFQVASFFYVFIFAFQVASLATSASAIALRAQRRNWEEDAMRMKLRLSSMLAGHTYYPGAKHHAGTLVQEPVYRPSG